MTVLFKEGNWVVEQKEDRLEGIPLLIHECDKILEGSMPALNTTLNNNTWWAIKENTTFDCFICKETMPSTIKTVFALLSFDTQDPFRS